MRSGRVLVVEDEPSISRICMRTLKGEGFEVEIAVDGNVGKYLLGQNDYDLCFIDIRTPGMSGMELFQYLAAEKPEQASKTIFTTGDILSPGVESFLAKANRPYLAKPFTPDELRAVVRKEPATPLLV